MIKQSTGTLELPTLSAVALWKSEIQGQLSDGMWENSGPRGHWVFWCNLAVSHSIEGRCRTVADSSCYGDFRCKKVGYNIASLYPIVGDRMVTAGRMGRALDALGRWTGNEDDFRQVVEAGETLSKMTYEEFKAAKADLPTSSHDFVQDRLNSVSDEVALAFIMTKYTMRDLKKDVSMIKAAMKTVTL